MVHAFTIEPITYNAFNNEAEQIDKCKEWGLLSDKASKTKAFHYKRYGQNLACSIIGYVDTLTAVIEFDNKQLHCIHPSYLKEMQASSYGQKLTGGVEEAGELAEAEGAELETPQSETKPEVQSDVQPVAQTDEAAPVDKPKAGKAKTEESKTDETSPKAPAKKGKATKVQLPEEKVKMIATVKEFTTVPNHFADEDDEVIIYEAVSLVEPETELGEAWSSHSATIKKLELEVGDTITFEAKIAAKKLTKHPVPYKINNPSKIQKQAT